ncbi:MAG TPA: lactate racemase domain-containing protein, partial [Geminicoccaceae bacterium]|nr:lactate racemase domain-containing protein [Geminicoccaceae bacterium]
MLVELNYGRGRLPVELDPGLDVTVIRKRTMPVLPDPVAAVHGALANPVNSPPLAEIARGRRTACILICDITRPVPNCLFL